MPTGYTAGIEDGTVTTFKAFAWSCARAFGALVTMRDDPMDAPIPEDLKPSDYYVESVQRSEVNLGRLLSMTEDEASAAALADHEKAIKCRDEYVERKKRELARYTAMLVKVRNWKPPSPEHESMKAFMLQQIDISMPASDYSPTVEPLLSGSDWRLQQIARATETLERDRKALREEEERARDRNKWLRQLRESLAKLDE